MQFFLQGGFEGFCRFISDINIARELNRQVLTGIKGDY